MSGIQLKLLADTSNAIKGTKDVGKAFEQVADSLEEVARESADASRNVTGDMSDVARSADDSADKLERSFREAFDTARKESRDAGDDVARNTRTGFDDAGEKVKDFKDEARANFSEVASSFQGDFNSAIDGVQGTLGGLATSPALGPTGMIAAGVGAAAAGFVAAWRKSAEETKQRISDMYDDMAESGADYLSKEYVTDQISKIINSAEGAAISMGELKRLSEDTGIAQSDLLLAFGGDLETRRRLLDDLAGDYSGLAEAAGRASQGMQTDADEELISRNQLLNKLRDQNTAQAEALEGIQQQREAVSKLNATQGRTYDDQIRNLGEVYDQLGTIKDAVTGMPSTKVRVDVDTSDVRADVDAALKRKFKIGVVVGGVYGKGIQ